jgi:ketosteroid isomerase-like protein
MSRPGDVKAIQEQILTADYESCAGYLPGECWGRETSIKVVSNFSNTIPDLKFNIVEVLVAGDRVIVRGEVTGTPAGELFGVPHSGKSFRIMAVDIQTIRDGKIAKTFHMENWLSAIGQTAPNRRAPSMLPSKLQARPRAQITEECT